MQNIKFLFFGFIAALGALVVELLLSLIFPEQAAQIFAEITFLLFLLAVVEEMFKFSVLFRSVSATSVFVPSLFVSAGFALTEVFLVYTQNAGIAQSGLYLLLGGIGMIHLVTGLICGYAAAFYKQTNRTIPASILFFLALVLHLIYNVAIIKSIKS